MKIVNKCDFFVPFGTIFCKISIKNTAKAVSLQPINKKSTSMKVTVIGAGNMGGAIARGLAKGTIVGEADITVADPSEQTLQKLQQEHTLITVSHDNRSAIAEADIVIVAVKPWLMKTVLAELPLQPQQVLVSVAAGICFEQLVEYTALPSLTMFRIVPNTAMSQLQSMTLIAEYQATSEHKRLLLEIFNEMGMAMLIPESQIAATTALTSCGIAYVLKYIQAAMQAGVEMGIYPKDAQRMVAQSVMGAASLILNNDTHPAIEIDKVTTPGGITIKGINELEHNGFTSAVIRAIKASR